MTIIFTLKNYTYQTLIAKYQIMVIFVFKTCEYMHSHLGINKFIKPKIWFYHMSFNSNLKLDHLKFGYNPFIHIFSITMKEV